jgi:hypothetical protein
VTDTAKQSCKHHDLESLGIRYEGSGPTFRLFGGFCCRRCGARFEKESLNLRGSAVPKDEPEWVELQEAG